MDVGAHWGLGLLQERELISSISRLDMGNLPQCWGSHGLSVLHSRGGRGSGHDLGLCGLLDVVLARHFEGEESGGSFERTLTVMCTQCVSYLTWELRD